MGEGRDRGTEGRMDQVLIWTRMMLGAGGVGDEGQASTLLVIIRQDCPHLGPSDGCAPRNPLRSEAVEKLQKVERSWVKRVNKG